MSKGQGRCIFTTEEELFDQPHDRKPSIVVIKDDSINVGVKAVHWDRVPTIGRVVRLNHCFYIKQSRPRAESIKELVRDGLNEEIDDYTAEMIAIQLEQEYPNTYTIVWAEEGTEKLARDLLFKAGSTVLREAEMLYVVGKFSEEEVEVIGHRTDMELAASLQLVTEDTKQRISDRIERATGKPYDWSKGLGND